MNETLLLALIGIAVVDSLNPSLFLAQFYLLTTPNPVPRILAYIGGVLAVNLAGGILIIGGARTLIGALIDRLSGAPLRGVELVTGLLILVVGLAMKGSPADATARQPRSLLPLHAFGLGAVVMLNELTTAFPYFVAIERIAQAGLGAAGDLLALLLYNLVFAAPLLVFLVAFLTLRQRFTGQLDRISGAIRRWAPRVFKYGAIAVGVALALDAAGYFVTGEGLW